MRTGVFIAIEGLDGAGTTTQIRLLGDWLKGRGIHSEQTREPSDSLWGSAVRRAIAGVHSVDNEALDDEVMALAFATDRLYHLRAATKGILPTLARGIWVVTDRYLLSSLAYQGASGVELRWLEQINSRAPAPDMTIFVDTPPPSCMDRIATRSSNLELFESEGQLSAIAGHYRRLLNRRDLLGQLVLVDGSLPIDVVASQIFSALEVYVERWLEPEPTG